MSQYKDVHLDDVGTVFRITLKEDGAIVPVNGATVQKIRFYRPEAGVIEKTSVFTTDGTNGQIQYVAEAGFLNEVGTWKLQGYVELPEGKWSSEIGVFTVSKNL